ncbi:phosphate ABC transporter permease PstA [Tahibacter harae]|uniref:Phosphate transport system permease protein PstA n=1 Tax=Tahibacter harae TaxID=2963937 RepID=A0ABT1QRF0_9GAMM|nr:phosphate ABC transporter permease PstA [Tahibacter harae]MCQ4164832.1 phosphate ABC transporter permease PstA [Tahibacter harae]
MLRTGTRHAPRRRGDSGLWLAAGAVALSLAALIALLFVLLQQSARPFLPAAVAELRWQGAAGPQQALAAIVREDADELIARASEWQRRGGAYLRIARADLLERTFPPDALALRLADGRELYLRGDAHALAALPSAAGLALPGMPAELPLRRGELVEILAPNQLGPGGRLRVATQRAWAFVSGSPGGDSGSAGLLPALVGTVVLVLLMSVLVMPLGVLVALWLHEYAGRGALAQLLRAAVANLAGVPSVIYGLFGLVLFVHGLGAGLDALFHADALPSPTWGTGGLLWSALTLALLTLPVVVIAVEEGLARVPAGLRQGALALGATRAEMLWRVVLPVARPALLTALILAVARAAGEVAPLMLVGAVKYAPALPLDGEFPYLHLSKQFMHLGHSVYDLALTGADAQRDLGEAHAAALLLLIVVVALNAAAIVVRNRLRERSRELSA